MSGTTDAEHALAAQALVNFRREIASNLATLDSVYPQHVAIVKRLGTAAETPRPAETAFQALVGVLPADFRPIPPLADAAW